MCGELRRLLQDIGMLIIFVQVCGREKVACLTHGTHVERGKVQYKQYTSIHNGIIYVDYIRGYIFRTIENKENNIIVIKSLP